MAYVPQFIPTDTKVLQGILDEHQQAYDYNTKRQEQLQDTVASIDATRPYDVQKKAEFLKQVEAQLPELDKLYNFDRGSSQYARDLTSRITKIKSDPYWAFKKEVDEMDKVRKDAKLKLMGDYFETTDPTQATMEDRSPLTDFRVYNKKEIDAAGAQFAAAWKVSDRGMSIMNDPKVPGYTFLQHVTGSRTVEEAYKKMNSPEGEKLVDDMFAATEFAPYLNNPELRNRLKRAAAEGMVGKVDISTVDDKEYDWNAKMAAELAKNQPGAPMTVGTQTVEGTNQKFFETKQRKVEEIDANIEALNAKDTSTMSPQQLEAHKYALDLYAQQKQRMMDVIKEKESTPEAKVLLDKAKQRAFDISTEHGFNPTGVNKESFMTSLFEDLKDYYVNTQALSRNNPWSKNSEDQKFKEVLAKIKEADPAISSREARNMAQGLINDARDMYNGSGLYDGEGYIGTVENPVNRQLKAGTSDVYEVVVPPYDTKSTEYQLHVDNMTRVLNWAVPVTPSYTKGEGDSAHWDEKELEKAKRAVGLPDTSISYMSNNRDDVLINLKNPGNAGNPAVDVTFKIDPKRSTYDILVSMARSLGTDMFLDVMYKGFTLKQNTKVQMTSPEMLRQVMRIPMFKTGLENGAAPDLTGLEQYSVQEVVPASGGERKYEIYYGNDKEPLYEFNQLKDMLFALKSIRDASKTK